MTHEELLKHVDETIEVGQVYKVLNIANPLCIIFKESEDSKFNRCKIRYDF